MILRGTTTAARTASAPCVPARHHAGLTSTNVKDVAQPAEQMDRAAPAVVRRHDTAVVLHFYYSELWSDIRRYLLNLGSEFDLFVTLPAGAYDSERLVKADFPDACIFRCENRGRDVAPFLRVLAAIGPLDYSYICKIHSKRSIYRGELGEQWMREMYDGLLGSPAVISRIKKSFDENPTWGLIAPEGHVVPHNYFWKQNQQTVMRLADSIGIDTRNLDFTFVAGTMFWFRAHLFDALLALDLRADDFEVEQGRPDGTLAHAIERLFGLLTQHEGYQIAESGTYGVKLAQISYQFRTLVNVVEWYEAQVAERDTQISHLQSAMGELQKPSLAWRIYKLLRRVEVWVHKNVKTVRSSL